MNCLKCANYWKTDIDESKCDICHICPCTEAKESEKDE